jgi:hypothetical protein
MEKGKKRKKILKNKVKRNVKMIGAVYVDCGSG